MPTTAAQMILSRGFLERLLLLVAVVLPATAFSFLVPSSVNIAVRNSISMADTSAPPGEGLRVLVLGATGGLGGVITKGFVERGYKTVATCRSSDKDLAEMGCELIIEDVDVTKADKVAAMVKKLQEKDMKLDRILVVAGLLIAEEFGELKYDANMKMYDVCALGPLRVVEALVNAKMFTDGAKIGLITSEGGSIGLRTDKEGGDNYGHHMSKAAENMMGKILAIDLKPKGLPVVMIHPGFMKTEMTEIYKDKWEEFGAKTPAESVPGIIDTLERCTLDSTGQFIAPRGSQGLGMGVNALEKPEDYGPFSQLPW